MVDAIQSALVDNLISAILLFPIPRIFGNRADQAEAEIEQWKTFLNDFRHVLQNVDDKKQDFLVHWLEDLEQLVCKVEDIMDKLKYEMELASANLPREYASRCWRFLTKSKTFWSKSKMLKELRVVTLDMELLKVRVVNMNLFQSSIGTSSKIKCSKGASGSMLNESVFARDEEKEAIFRLLLTQEDDEARILVIPIVGMGGLGKTTLAKYVYNDSRVECSFDVRVWVWVSSDYDPTRIYKEILQSVCNNCSVVADKSLDWIQRNLGEALRDKKLLLVLDDYWNDNYADWNALGTVCLPVSPGSRIIVTTRSHYVAKSVSAVNPIIPRHLSPGDFWSLLCFHAELDENAASVSRLEKIGKRIAGKCSGLPLAATSVGGHLRHITKVKLWEAILNTMWKDRDDEVISAVRRSYDDLNFFEKRCLSFLSIFPKDYKFGEHDVVLMWIGARLIHFEEKEEEEEEGNRMIEMVHKVFRSLVAKSLLSPINGNSTELYVMHDMVRHLAQQACTMNRCIEKDDPIDKSFKGIRHLSFHGSKLEDTVNSIVKEEKLLLRLRTFWVLNDRGLKYKSRLLEDVFTRLKYIRVLRLQYLQKQKLPKSISQLTLLRYLDVSYSKIQKLPTSITSLFNLEILILEQCRKLQRLSKRIGNLCNLWYVNIRGTDRLTVLPKGIMKLSRLRNLSDFKIGKNLPVSSLQNLSHLQGSLTISNLQTVASPEDAASAQLSDKGFDKLTLIWNSAEISQTVAQRECDILERLTPYKDLKELKIESYAGSLLPSWLTSSLESLVVLDLANCKYCTCRLEAIASLQKLRIVGCQEGVEFLGSMPRLKNLEIRNCKEVACTERFSLDSLECVTVENVDVERMSPLFKERLSQGSRHARVLQFGVEWREAEIPGRNVIPDWKLPSIHLIGDDDSCQMKVQYLSVHNEARLDRLPKWVSNAPSLQELDVKDCPSLNILLPYGEFPSSLTELCISGCSQLESFHEEKLPTTIQKLWIDDCPVLDKKIEDRDQLLCSKISHVPSVQVNNRLISLLNRHD